MGRVSDLFLLWFTVTFVSIFWGSCHLLMRLFIVKCCAETLNAVPVALSHGNSFGCFCILVYRVKPFFPVLICAVFLNLRGWPRLWLLFWGCNLDMCNGCMLYPFLNSFEVTSVKIQFNYVNVLFQVFKSICGGPVYYFVTAIFCSHLWGCDQCLLALC